MMVTTVVQELFPAIRSGGPIDKDSTSSTQETFVLNIVTDSLVCVLLGAGPDADEEGCRCPNNLGCPRWPNPIVQTMYHAGNRAIHFCMQNGMEEHIMQYWPHVSDIQPKTFDNCNM